MAFYAGFATGIITALAGVAAGLFIVWLYYRDN